MARSDKRYSVYPSPRAVHVLGQSSPSLNQALECWASAIARATADNTNKFHQALLFDEYPEFEQHPLDDWCILAEALKDKPFDPEFANPAELLATAVEDAERFENLSWKWYHTEKDDARDKGPIERRDASIRALAKKLRELHYEHAWAIIIAVQWYWEHSDQVDIKKDEWWTLGFRREHENGQNKSLKEPQPGKSKKRIKPNQD